MCYEQGQNISNGTSLRPYTYDSTREYNAKIKTQNHGGTELIIFFSVGRNVKIQIKVRKKCKGNSN